MAKGKKSKRITVLYGLPGSGKSTYANEAFATVIDADAVALDSTIPKNNKLASLVGKVEGALSNKYTRAVVIDGLFTTNAQLRALLNALSVLTVKWQITYKLVWWGEDREACLINDQGRRDKNSIISIKNLPFEEPNPAIVPEFFVAGNVAIKLKVVCPPPVEKWARSLNLKDINGIDYQKLELKSQSWSLGGTIGSCWGDRKTTISPESPLEFIEFDELLGQVYPNISFLQYKEIKRFCCQINQWTDKDYYGGSETNEQHVCDLNKLHEKLSSLGVINI